MERVTILGVGALACLFGSRLAGVAGVTLVGRWPQQLERLRAGPLEVVELDGEVSRHRLPVRADVAEAAPADLVLVLVKSAATAGAAAGARRALAPGGLALTLQNGLGNLELLQAAVGAARAALGSTVQAAEVLAAGRIRHHGRGLTRLARTAATAARVKRAAELFNAAGIETEPVDDPERLLWSKVAVNVAINPLSALLAVPNGRLAEDPRSRSLVLRAAREAGRVAAARGIELEYADAGERALEVCRSTAANRSSMLQDLARGAPTEIDVLSGAVVRDGREYGAPAPVNEALWRLVRAREGRPVTWPWSWAEGRQAAEEIGALAIAQS